MKYPITPDYLAHVPDKLIDLYLNLEEFIIQKICESIAIQGEPNATALELIRQLQRRGMPLDEIMDRIKKTLWISDSELSNALNNAVQRNNEYYNAAFNALSIVQEERQLDAMQAEIEAITRQTQSVMQNITQSMGFGMRGPDGLIAMSDVQRTYQQILDRAEMKILSSGCSYNEALRDGIREMANSGLVGEWVEYRDESGEVYHRNRVEVAVRRAVMTGVTQISGQYTEMAAETMDTPYREISAHRGARDVDGPLGWENHKKWQGKVYSLNRGDKYPYIYTATGWGDVTGLEGANCRHMHFPFIEGFSERTYTDEQLRNIDRPPFTYQGRKYSAYEATQKQRQIETAMRKVKRRMTAFKAAGDEEAYNIEAARYRALSDEYSSFSKAADLPLQLDRTSIPPITGGTAPKPRIAATVTPPPAPKHKPVAENDVLQEYIDAATPGSGRISCDDGYDLKSHKKEIDTANWLHKTFGGDIKCLLEKNGQHVKTPDYEWRGKSWELKSITTENAASGQIRHALKQIEGNPGGIILNLEDNPYDLSVLLNVIKKRMNWHTGKIADILVVSDREAIAVLRYGNKN